MTRLNMLAFVDGLFPDVMMLLANLPWEPFPQIVRTPPHGGKGAPERVALMTSRIGTGDIQRAQSPTNDPKKRSVALSESSPATSFLWIIFGESRQTWLTV